ncbi:PE domain-containing protein [Mycobacterium koreense]|uniref:PE family protein n=1 Tax=Mycolicibacillus koreensis TaxID=1069220 RepID=A0AA91PBH1_9MYCO|nr:PE domain-containing protein [Mycolicibacillus koreensis]ODR04178.1 hypothetical protein BHQ15_17430 [Mycolicibacillus koreensis]OSC27781.1 hypothetical protein B8W67_17945 [Mycolicibacillus koreensis]
MSLLDVNTVAVEGSALLEAALGGEMAATTAGGAAALVGVIPMALDADSAAFAAALNAAGAAYLGVAADHVGHRAALAGGQNLASLTYVVNEVASSLALTL